MNDADLLCPLGTGAVTILSATTKTPRLWLITLRPQASGLFDLSWEGIFDLKRAS